MPCAWGARSVLSVSAIASDLSVSNGPCKRAAKEVRRSLARHPSMRLGLGIRFIVTSLAKGSPAWLYETIYCARGQAENLIKLYKRPEPQ